MVWCGVVWCGVVRWGGLPCVVVWCGVVWCGVVWYGVVWCGVVKSVVWCVVVWCCVVRHLVARCNVALYLAACFAASVRRNPKAHAQKVAQVGHTRDQKMIQQASAIFDPKTSDKEMPRTVKVQCKRHSSL